MKGDLVRILVAEVVAIALPETTLLLQALDPYDIPASVWSSY